MLKPEQTKQLAQLLDVVACQTYRMEYLQATQLDEIHNRALGKIVSNYVEQDIPAIFDIFLTALEDCNAHTEVATIKKLFPHYCR